MLQKPAGPSGPLGFKTLPVLGRLQNLLLPLYFRGNVSLCHARSSGGRKWEVIFVYMILRRAKAARQHYTRLQAAFRHVGERE